jgi:hypothetical protein
MYVETDPRHWKTQVPYPSKKKGGHEMRKLKQPLNNERKIASLKREKLDNVFYNSFTAPSPF